MLRIFDVLFFRIFNIQLVFLTKFLVCDFAANVASLMFVNLVASLNMYVYSTRIRSATFSSVILEVVSNAKSWTFSNKKTC